MQVSVIIPAYNAASTIDRTIRSIQTQSFTDWELIVIDDCSADKTAEIVRQLSLSDSRISLHSMPHNSGGAFVPRVHGFRLAQAPMLVPVDADDTVNPDYLSALVSRRNSASADLVLSAVDLVSPDGTSRPYLPAEGIDQNHIYVGRDLVKETIEHWRVSGLGLFDREIAVRVADRIGNTSHPFADEVFTRQLLHAADRVALCGEALYHYAMNPKSVTHRTDNHTYFQRLELSRDLLVWCMENYTSDSVEYALFQKINALSIVAALRDRTIASLLTYRKTIKQNLALVDFSVLKPQLPAKYYYPLKFTTFGV